MALSDVLSETVAEMEWYLQQPSYHYDRVATEVVIDAIRRLLWILDLPLDHPDRAYLEECVREQTRLLGSMPKLIFRDGRVVKTG